MRFLSLRGATRRGNPVWIASLLLAMTVFVGAAQAKPVVTHLTDSANNAPPYCKVFFKDKQGITYRAIECFEATVCIATNFSNPIYPQEEYRYLIAGQYTKQLYTEDFDKCHTPYEINNSSNRYNLTSEEVSFVKTYEEKNKVPNEEFYVINYSDKINKVLNKHVKK
jgi:hypothetical protein